MVIFLAPIFSLLKMCLLRYKKYLRKGGKKEEKKKKKEEKKKKTHSIYRISNLYVALGDLCLYCLRV